MTIDHKERSFNITVMSRSDVDVAIGWARQEGWNPGLQDAEAFYVADSGGFLLGQIDGEPVATLSAVRYGDDFGFIGLYIVDPAHRGRGHGWQIWQAGMASLAGRNVGLDGVVAQQDNYRRSGFRLAHRNIRFGGRAAALGRPSADIVPASRVNWQALTAYDRAHFPAPREAFLRHWIAAEQATALVCLDGSRIVGFGCLRPCVEGYKIGPLNAADPDTAARLYDALAATATPGAPIFLDVPEPNAAGIALAESKGLQPVFETARMYTGTPPPLPLDRIYGITSFELG
ncbi:MAG: GNAT family N-acetyltransferase [Xanthomonadales bacterium]|nr:GNAT family N-acetyltransferase [Xanthomonadales bacterium]